MSFEGFEDLEDLLFGAVESQQDLETSWDDGLEDEGMFDVADGLLDLDDDDLFDASGLAPADAWQLLSSPLLTPVDVSNTPNHSAVIDSVENGALSADVCKRGRDRYWVVARLEAMLEKVIDSLLEDSDKMTLTLKSRASISRRQPVTQHDNTSTPAAKVRQVSFPGSTAQEAWNFAVLLRIIEIVHGGLVDNVVMTKRDIYYRHPDLFVRQAVVDRNVDDLACTLGISRSQLNVTAAAKGLVAGRFTIHRDDGTQVDGPSNQEGMLVPKIGETDRLDVARILWVIIIEKEATFSNLISNTRWHELTLNGLVVTAKGYPDVASRSFLRHLANQAPHIPMYALMDLDPDGIAIMTTYKYGSYRLAHEGLTHKDAPALSLPNLRWLGVKQHHVSRARVVEDGTEAMPPPELQGLMRLTARDRTKAMRMLEWDLCTETGLEHEWRRELQTMLMLNTKAEIQILDELPGGVVSFLSSELDQVQGRDVDMVVDKACSEDGLLF